MIDISKNNPILDPYEGLYEASYTLIVIPSDVADEETLEPEIALYGFVGRQCPRGCLKVEGKVKFSYITKIWICGVL